MNQFSGFTRSVFGGHHAMVRLPMDGQAKPILGEGGHPRIYRTKVEAQEAIIASLCGYVNGAMRRDGEIADRLRAEADRLFLGGGRTVPVEVKRRRA